MRRGSGLRSPPQFHTAGALTIPHHDGSFIVRPSGLHRPQRGCWGKQVTHCLIAPDRGTVLWDGHPVALVDVGVHEFSVEIATKETLNGFVAAIPLSGLDDFRVLSIETHTMSLHQPHGREPSKIVMDLLHRSLRQPGPQHC